MEERITRSIDAHISRFLAETGETVEQLAEYLGITSNTLRNKRAGRTDWQFAEIVKLSELLCKSLTDLAYHGLD